MTPSYLALYRTGELAKRADAAVARLASCDLCPHACGADRSDSAQAADPTGYLAKAVCRTGRHARVASIAPGFSEEPAIVGRNGSGDITFSWCNMRCVYCENAEVTMGGTGEDMDAPALAAAMLSLQAQGCHNINLVGPSHVIPQILEALVMAAGQGLTLPLVYNTGGYDTVSALELLDGVVDIYTPDIKYSDDMAARRCSRVRDYVAVNRAALAEMVRQVGALGLDDQGQAQRGVLVRHLVLPRDLGNVTRILDDVSDLMTGHGMTVSILDGYHPAYQADRVPGLSDPVRREVITTARTYARQRGLTVL